MRLLTFDDANGPQAGLMVEEDVVPAPAAPLWSGEFANSLIGSGQEIVLPAAHPDYVDYEAELAVVIGRTANRWRGWRRCPSLPGRCRSTT